MAVRIPKNDGNLNRVSRHRRRLEAKGAKRVAVTIPARDARLVKVVAAALRAGGVRAEKVRAALSPLVPGERAKTGQDLVAFFRTSPLTGEDLEFGRDRPPGRCADIS